MATSLLSAILIIAVFLKPTFQKSYSVSNSRNQYGVILDGGSTSTKIRIYHWFDNGHVNDVPEIHLAKNYRVKISIERLVHSPKLLENVFTDSINKAVEFINESGSVSESDFSEIPLYFMSTAGTRTLSGHQARRFERNIRRILSNITVNPFYYEHRHVQILSGEEEGVYSWLATNYLLGFLNTTGNTVTPVGVLEMGGGSTQIAFIPHDPLFGGEFHLYVSKRRYDIYVHSYLNFGMSYMKERVRKWLIHHHHNTSIIPDPCALTGDEYPIKHHNMTRVIQGRGNMSECREIINSFLKKAEGDSCSPKPCAIGQVYQPDVTNTTFYAFGGYKYTPSSLNAIDDFGILNITHLIIAAEEHCQKNILEIDEQDRRYGSEECLMGVYLPLLLTKSYGFDETTSNIIVSDRVKGRKTDWTLGVMLHEVLSMQAAKALEPSVEIHCPGKSQSVLSSAPKHLSKIRVDLLVVYVLIVQLFNTFYLTQT